MWTYFMVNRRRDEFRNMMENASTIVVHAVIALRC